jgi:hypothetical protein
MMPSQPSYQDTNISLKTGLKNIRRSTPTGDQNHPSETREEVSNQTINFETDFTILATQLKEIKLTNISSATKEYIWQTAASLENKRNDILQQQQILNDWAEQCRTIDVDVSKRIENQKKSIELHNQVRESQLKTVLDYAEEVKEFLLEIQRQDHSFPAEPNISCKLDSQSRITQNPRKIRKKKKKQILPPPQREPQTLEPEKTDQTQHFPTNEPTAKTQRDAPDFIRTTELVPQTQHPPQQRTNY